MTRSLVMKIKLAYHPDGVSDAELAGFIWDALESWGGSFHPEDPLFHSLELEHIQISKTKYT